MKKSLILVFIISCLVILTIPREAKAKTLQDMYNELANLQAQYDKNKQNRELTQSEIDNLNTEITSINTRIDEIREEIKQTEADIEESKEKIEEKKVETDGLIQFLQVSNGGNIYLEYLFDAENYTDFIYRYEVVKQLTNYNSSLIDELEALILELQAKEEELSQKNTELESNRVTLTKKVATLTNNLKSYKTEGVDLEADIRDLKNVIKVYEDMGCGRDQDIDACTSSVNAYGWSYPLNKGCVTSNYGWRTYWLNGRNVTDFHYGIDLSCVPEGSPVYAAATGTVARITKTDCGGNAVYLTHTVLGKKYTTQYLHLLSISSDMYVGKVVTDSTVIGYMGGYSTSTAHGGYDRCTTGAHLHFGIAEGHNAYNYFTYSINPREIYTFPVLVYSGGGYFYR